jgi:hypothetical protein
VNSTDSLAGLASTSLDHNMIYYGRFGGITDVLFGVYMDSTSASAFNFELILSVKYIVLNRFQSNWHHPGNVPNPYVGCIRYTILVISQLATTTQDTGCRASEYAILTGFLPKKAEGVRMPSSMVGPIDFCLDCRCSCHPILFQTGEHNAIVVNRLLY